MDIILYVWFLVGIVTGVFYLSDTMNKNIKLDFSDFVSLFFWISLGPLLWILILCFELINFIKTIYDKHREK